MGVPGGPDARMTADMTVSAGGTTSSQQDLAPSERQQMDLSTETSSERTCCPLTAAPVVSTRNARCTGSARSSPAPDNTAPAASCELRLVADASATPAAARSTFWGSLSSRSPFAALRRREESFGRSAQNEKNVVPPALTYDWYARSSASMKPSAASGAFSLR